MSTETTLDSEHTKERAILKAMRKTLARVVRETAPTETQGSPFSEETVGDIQECFKLIAARERELADLAGATAQERPYFGGDRPTTQNVNVVSIDKARGPERDPQD